MVLTILSLISLAAALIQTASAFKVGQAVKTTSGALQGHTSSWQPGVNEYLGIPYTLLPLGTLRFAGLTTVQSKQ
jgi:hypothetical protein